MRRGERGLERGAEKVRTGWGESGRKGWEEGWGGREGGKREGRGRERERGMEAYLLEYDCLSCHAFMALSIF